MTKRNKQVQSLDDVALLPGVGLKTARRLYQIGVQTYADLISHVQPSLVGVDIPKLQQKAQEQLSAAKDTRYEVVANHSWMNRTVHLLRTDRRITRAKVHRIQINACNVSVSVIWTEKGKTHVRTVSPFNLIFLQFAWLGSDIVSDDSDQDSVPPLDDVLPALILHHRLSGCASVGIILREVNRFLAYTNHCQPGPLVPSDTGLETVSELNQHSWAGSTTVCLRGVGRVTRVEVGSMVICAHSILLRVYWTQDDIRRRALVTPVSLLCYQKMAMDHDIVTDHFDCLPALYVSPSHTNLTKLQINGLGWLVAEVNQMRSFLFRL
jgi:hypothetical protein